MDPLTSFEALFTKAEEIAARTGIDTKEIVDRYLVFLQVRPAPPVPTYPPLTVIPSHAIDISGLDD